MKQGIIFVLVVLLAACSTDRKQVSSSSLTDSVQTELRYATGFRVTYKGTSKQVDVLSPYQGASSGYSYLLVPKNEVVPAHPENVRVIRTPITTIVCTSTTHIPLLDYLNETDALVGFCTTDYISSEKMRARIDAGKVEELGVDKGINVERLVMLKPDMVMGYTMSGDYGQFKKIEELSVPAVINAEYLERHPLGRAEWIKFMALFFNKEKEADSVFREIEKNYNNAMALVGQATTRPTVVSGVAYGDAWFLPGGKNYAAKLLDDAGCRYLWADDSTTGFLELSFEAVYQKAYKADRWIGVGSYKSLDELKAADERYAKLNPFQQKEVYSYNARIGAKGGSEFLELGYLRPDIILQDLIKIAHPELLPDHRLFFHKRLE